jgi:hypothetical protein
MNALLFLVAVAALQPEKAAVPEVRALLVTHLEFKEKDREKIAETALKLLSSCSPPCSSTEKDFESIRRQCHLYVKFGKPREVKAGRENTVKVDELIVSFPTNTGGIWVRIDKDYYYYTKFDCDLCKVLHELLKAGKPS